MLKLLVFLLIGIQVADCSITFSPLIHSGKADYFTVSWDGIEKPPNATTYTNDIVALYPSADVPLDITTAFPIAYVYPYLINPSAWSEGSGFYLHNYISDIQVVYLRGGSWAASPYVPLATVLAQGTLPLNKPNYPTTRVLSLTKTSGQMKATWATRDVGTPTVKWGTAPGQLTKSAVGTTSTYTRDDMCADPASGQGFLSPGTINTAVMTGLYPNTRYYYVVGDPNFGFSPEATFKTNPADSLSLLMVADHGTFNRDKSRYYMGGYGRGFAQLLGIPSPGFLITAITALGAYVGSPASNSAETVTRALDRFSAQKKYHGVVINGDIAYGFGSLARYTRYIGENEKTFTSMPIIASSGNHEDTDPALPYGVLNGTDGQGECGIPYNKLFAQPSLSPERHWYSIDVGPVHFLQLSSDQDFKIGSAQYKFIVKDLAAVNRTKTPWVIAGYHRPLYMDDPDADTFGSVSYSAAMRENLEPLFVEHEVDITHSGHIHMYHRTCPIIKGRCVRNASPSGVKAPIHLVAGNAGAPAVYLAYTDVPTWADKEILSLGLGTLNVNRTHLEWKMYTGTGPTKVSVADTLVLTKPLGWKPNRTAAKALYDSTEILPPAEAKIEWASTLVVTGSLLSLAQANPQLAFACFGPDTDIFKIANANEIPTMIPSQSWKFQASMLTFIKGTWKGEPGAVLNGYTTEQIQESLDYAYNVIVKGRMKLGSLPPGCAI